MVGSCLGVHRLSFYRDIMMGKILQAALIFPILCPCHTVVCWELDSSHLSLGFFHSPECMESFSSPSRDSVVHFFVTCVWYSFAWSSTVDPPTIAYLSCFEVWQWCLKLLWTFLCRHLYAHMFSTHWSRCQGGCRLDLMVEYISFSKEVPSCLPERLCHFVFRQATNEKKPCGSVYPPACLVSILELGHYSRCAVVSHHSLILKFPNNYDVECFLIVMLARFVSLWWGVYSNIFAHFKVWVFFFHFYCWILSIICIYYIIVFYQICFSWIVSLSLVLCFHSPGSVFYEYSSSVLMMSNFLFISL